MSNDDRRRERPHAVGRQGRGAWTLVELLVVLAVTSVFLLGVLTAFVQILRASDRSERMSQAYQNARAAVEAISLVVKAARIEPTQPYQYFQGVNTATPSGDRIDNDRDSRVDEEQPNGLDDDGDWDATRDDHHLQAGTASERRQFVGRADLGDGHVDEDNVFHRDQLSLAIFPDPAIPGSRSEITSFSIGSWESENNVLLQRTLRNPGSGAAPELGPLAYNVLSLVLLYWDPNKAEPYWVEEWDAMHGTFPSPGLQLPAAVYISVTVYSGHVPLEQLGPAEPIETVTASTVVDIESVIHDPRYDLLVRPHL